VSVDQVSADVGAFAILYRRLPVRKVSVDQVSADVGARFPCRAVRDESYVSVDQVSADVDADISRQSLYNYKKCLSIRSVLTSAPTVALDGFVVPGVSVDQVSADVGARDKVQLAPPRLSVCRSGQC